MLFSIAYAQTMTDYKRISDLQILQLTSSEKEAFKDSFVIIKGDLIFVDTEEICGVELAKIVISEKIIKNPEERFFIAHLIRNVLIDGAVIKNYDGKDNDFRMAPCVLVDEEYIIKHKENIIKVLYYLMHKNYFNLYGKSQGSGEKIFYTSLLNPIKTDLMKLRKQLLDENAILPIDDDYDIF